MKEQTHFSRLDALRRRNSQLRSDAEPNAEVGTALVRALVHLHDNPYHQSLRVPRVERMTPHAEALGAVVELDRRIPDPELPLRGRRLLYQEAGRWHAALPFGDEERAWIDVVTAGRSSAESAYYRLRELEEQEVSVNGLRRRFTGFELIRRWEAWREEHDEFAGQETVAIARSAIRAMVDVVGLEPGSDAEATYEYLSDLSDYWA